MGECGSHWNKRWLDWETKQSKSSNTLIFTVNYFSTTPASRWPTLSTRLWLLSDAPAHSKERIAPSGKIDRVINLHENELRIYDPAKPERCKHFSVVSGTHSGPFVIDPRAEHYAAHGLTTIQIRTYPSNSFKRKGNSFRKSIIPM